MTSQTLNVPQEYIDKSKTLVKLYDDFVFTGESLDKLIIELRDILMDAGFSKTQAMMKISDDHRHLRKFSLKNIYQVLPKEQKQQYSKKPELIEDSSRTNFSQIEKTLSQNNIIEEPSELEKFRQEKGKQTTADEIKEWDLPEPRDEQPQQEQEQEGVAEAVDDIYNLEEEKEKEESKDPVSFEDTENYLRQYREFETTKQLLQEARMKIEDQEQKIQQLAINQINTNIIRRGIASLELGSEVIESVKCEYDINKNKFSLRVDDSVVKAFWRKVWNG